MKLDTDSLYKILGDSKEVLVFGFETCGYVGVNMRLRNMQFKVYPNIDIKLIDYENNNFDYKTAMSRRCKAIVTSVILENYKRSKTSKPFIRVLFCIAFKSHSQTHALDINRLITSSLDPIVGPSITDQELRRCFQLCTDMPAEIQAIAEKSIKFVKLTEQNNSKVFNVEELPAFWSNENWKKTWAERNIKHIHQIENKAYPYRKILVDEINRFNLAPTFFYYQLKNKINDSKEVNDGSIDLPANLNIKA